ncbi:MAG: DUF1499 domain-containing protein [Pseudomonadales bacterium]|nr:DUF1499 domain-containing protein [Pseudomonadales bacterium]
MSEDTANNSKGFNWAGALKVDAILCLVAGVGIGLVALAGPVAVWFGAADFGFRLLGVVNSYADWIAGGTFIIAMAIAAVAKIKQIPNGLQLSALALIGTISASLAYVIPESFRPAEDIPPIHDIATDPYRPLEFVAIAPLRADAANTMEYGGSEDMTPRLLIELTQTAYPDIVPQRFDDSVEEVFGRALEAAESLGWEIVAADVNQGRIEATDTTFWFRFKDDVVIEITVDGRESVLNARSLSRVGRGDVGKNAARLREFFALL